MASIPDTVKKFDKIHAFSFKRLGRHFWRLFYGRPKKIAAIAGGYFWLSKAA